MADLDDVDIRSVAVIWAEDDEPTVEFSGCSPYEAIGLLDVALRYMRLEYAMEQLDEDEDA